MVSAEAPQSRSTGRALALGSTLILAKGLALAGRSLTLSVWTLPAFIWHDVAVACAFGLVDRLTRRSKWMLVPYGAAVLLAAIDVPVTRTLSSPLTMPMLRAAGFPLLDSITRYVTAANVTLIVAVVLAGVVLPAVFARVPRRSRLVIATAAIAVAAIGPFAVSKTATLGLHRNGVTAIVTTALPRVTSKAGADEWRASIAVDAGSQDLASLRGAAAGKNVVVIALESTAAQYLSTYGAADDPMPVVSSLAKTSLVFDPAYAVYPESIKGFFSTLCSRDPAFDVTAEAHAGTSCDSLARTLGGAGYRTALFHSGRFIYLGMQPIVDNAGFELAEDAGAIGGNVHSSFGVDEPATVQRMLAWIDGLEAGRKFFLTYLPIAGHHPYATATPGPFTDPGELGAYKNALREADAAVGSLIAGLRARGHADDTLVVLYGDHGEAFGQHPGNAGHSLFLYDENVRVPLIISGAGSSPQGNASVRVSRVSSLLDVTPTVLDLLGMPARPSYAGTSLLEPRHRMALFFTDYAVGWLGLRDECWKFIYEIDSKRAQLYDVCRDPGERVNVADREPARVALYQDRVVRWSAARRAEITAR